MHLSMDADRGIVCCRNCVLAGSLDSYWHMSVLGKGSAMNRVVQYTAWLMNLTVRLVDGTPMSPLVVALWLFHAFVVLQGLWKVQY